MRYKKALIVWSLALLTITALAATTYTTHYDLAKPADGDVNWGSSYRENMNIIDGQMWIEATGLQDHITDTTGAHAASAISSTVGASLCTSAASVQAFLDCLDSNFGAIIGGTVVTTNTAQTITGQKTFTQALILPGGVTGGLTTDSLTVTGLGSDPYLLNDGGGVITSSDAASFVAGFEASINHNALANLTAGDVHTQYALLAGRSGGQTLTGGTAASNSLTLRSTSNASKGQVYVDETTASSSTTTGALRVGGGLGVGEDIYAVGSINAASAVISGLTNGFVKTTSGALSGVASVNLASADVSGTLPVARGGTGFSSVGGANNVFGVNAGGTDYEFKALAGTANQVIITHGVQLATFSLPQSIATGSSPTFTGLTLSGLSNGLVRSTTGVLAGAATVGLTSEVTGVLPIANGGSNKALTLAAGGVVWTDADSFEVSAAGSSGQLLQSNGTSAPSWVSPPAGAATYNAYAVDTTLSATSEQFVTCSGAGTDITLYACGAGQAGFKASIKRNDASNTCTVVADATGTPDTIDAAANYAITNDLQAITLVCDGSNDWFIF